MKGCFATIREWLERKEREQHLRRTGMDHKCPTCNRWQGNCREPGQFTDNGDDTFDLSCGNCGAKSRWLAGPVWIFIQPTQPAKEGETG